MSSPQKKRQRRLLIVSGVILVAVVIVLGLVALFVERARTVEASFERLENLARISDEVVSSRLRTIDLLLQDVAREAQAVANPADEHQLLSYMKARTEALAGVRTLTVTDAAGKVTYTTLPAAQGMVLADKPYYQKAVTAPDHGKLFLYGPFRAEATGAVIIIAVRANPLVDGRWSGATLSSLPSAYFSDVLETVRPKDGFAGLVGFEGTIMARSPGHEQFAGKNIAKGPAHAAHVASGQRMTRALVTTSTDGQRSFVVSRTTEFSELVASAGWREDAAMAQWRQTALIRIVFLSVLGVLATLTLRRFARHERELRHERNIALQAEQELAAGQRFIKAVADNMPDMIGYWDAELRCRFANRSYVDWFGKSPDEIVGRPMVDLLGEHLFALNVPYIRAALQGEPQNFERTLTRADGSIGHAWAHYIPDRDAAGAVIGFFVLVNDITPLKRTEFQLRAASARLSLAAAAAGVGIWEYDLRTRESTWDDRMYALYGLSPGDRRHAYSLWVQFLHPADLGRVEAEFADAVGECRDFSSEFRILMPDGGVRYFKTAAKPEYDAEGSPERMIGVNWDITAVRENEAALAAARAAAESANRAKSEFLANMSHEIRTPLTAVLGLAHLLERTPLSPNQRALVADIDVSGRALLALINNILDFSRVEAGRLELETTTFRLSDLLDVVQAIAAADAREKGLDLRVAVAPDAPSTLSGDSLRLQQVLTNLAGNAVKFTERGEVSITVETAGRRDGRTILKFIVADTGVGLAPDRLERLFDAFTQGDASTTRRFGGSGLGLAICKKLVVLMGGEIGADSRPGQGSRFWFTAPFAAVEAAAAAPPPRPAAEPPRLAGLRLLVVEDNKINQDVLRRVLALEGAEVELAGDGRQAVARLAAAPAAFDVVLMDIQMPEMDGCEAAEHIRGDLRLTALPIIALTAGALDAERNRALGAGMNDFITKPFDLDRMVQAILRMVGRAASPRPGGGNAADLEVAGIEMTEALRRMGGDRELQRRVMRGFVEQMADAADSARADWECGGAAAAARRLHALKGAAANIGAAELAAAAGRTERLLRLDAPPGAETGAQLAGVARLLATLCRDVSAALGDAGGVKS